MAAELALGADRAAEVSAESQGLNVFSIIRSWAGEKINAMTEAKEIAKVQRAASALVEATTVLDSAPEARITAAYLEFPVGRNEDTASIMPVKDTLLTH